MKQAVEVRILGQQFTVKSEASAEEARRVAEFVNGRILEVLSASRSADTLNSAILAMMNVSGAYLRLRDEAATERNAEIGGRLLRLLDRLEKNEMDGLSHDRRR